MDLDRYLATHKPSWDRLAMLSGGGRRGARARSTAEIDELVDRYQQASANLSFIRTHFPDPSLLAYLTRVVSQAAHAIYGVRPRSWRNAGRFFTITFPAAVYRARWFVAASAGITFVPALIVGLWLANSNTAAQLALPPAVREAYLQHDFKDYYQTARASQFASHVYTNNVQVSIGAFAGGIFLCIPTVILLLINGLNVGFAAGIFTHYGQAAKFWGLITPHGLVELTSVTIAGAAGLQLGWSIVSPGDRPRSVAATEEARRAVVMVLGLVFSLAIAGTIEGFVTGQPWATWLRVGIGVVAEVLFVGYLVIFGRRAAAAGFTGALGEGDQLGWATSTTE